MRCRCRSRASSSRRSRQARAAAGGGGGAPLDVKLIAATQTDLTPARHEGTFRADLYHRLAVVVLELPPLRERGDDILVLARHFLRQYAAAHGLPPKRLSPRPRRGCCAMPGRAMCAS